MKRVFENSSPRTLLPVELIKQSLEDSLSYDIIETMDNLTKNFADNLTFYRKKAGLTQIQLAELLNYSDKAISKWERGESVPDIGTLKQIADQFGLSIDLLIAVRTEDEKPLLAISAPDTKHRKHLWIALLSSTLVWLTATTAYALTMMIVPDLADMWKAFIVAIPVWFTVLVVFACIWGSRKTIFFMVSCLAWTLALSLFLLFDVRNNWMLFIIVVPVQVIFCLWFMLKKTE
jgi:transcriptional regulator with XRE-family HTH domain